MINKMSIPRGTRDYLPEEMYLKNKLIDQVASIFRKHGAVNIDTPTYEHKNILLGKYGDQQKLVFDLVDQDGSLCSLRYDLTVPFSRFMIMNGLFHLKRYQIAKVFRRDDPSIIQGRYREFQQCDFDIAGNFPDNTIQDAEVIKVMTEIYSGFEFNYVIRINNKHFLDTCLLKCGVPPECLTMVERSIDKLDKLPWSVIVEQLEDLNPNIKQQITNFIQQKFENPFDILDFGMIENEDREWFHNFLDCLNHYDCLEHIKIDVSLARGLDYYTGMIFEVSCINTDEKIGSIGGGGRYDNLIDNGQTKIPAVGGSVGIERIFTILNNHRENPAVDLHVTIAIIESRMQPEEIKKLRFYAMDLLNALWNLGLSADMCNDTTRPMREQMIEIVKKQSKYAIIIGQTELINNQIKIKKLETREQKTISISELSENIL